MVSMPGPEFRLLVTGSREWDDQVALWAALDGILGALPADVTLVVVHGAPEDPEDDEHDESSGMDQLARAWAIKMKREGLTVDQEGHPADWYGPCRDTCRHGGRRTWKGRSMCPAAGPYRNEEMAASGVHRGLAGLKVGTKGTGTRDCLKRMIRHGIQFEIIVQGDALGLPKDLIGRQGQGRPE